MSVQTVTASIVSLQDVHVAYGQREVFRSLSCDFPAQKISVILGGSGSGKSTIVRLISGLSIPRNGKVIVDGDDVTRLSNQGLRNLRRKLSMLFQGGALLDSYTVFENLALPLREEQRKLTPPQIADAVHVALESVGLRDIDHLLPNQLSGGMLRRVALASALIRKPSILLCDEPFSGLDPASIKRIESLFIGLNREGMTLLVVSHHVPSTLRMADKILLLVNGRKIEGTPQELRDSSDPDVADFLNEGAQEKIRKW